MLFPKTLTKTNQDLGFRRSTDPRRGPASGGHGAGGASDLPMLEVSSWDSFPGSWNVPSVLKNHIDASKGIPTWRKGDLCFQVCFPFEGHSGSLDSAPAKPFSPRARPCWRSWLKRERRDGNVRGQGEASPEPSPASEEQPAAWPTAPEKQARPQTQSGHCLVTAPFVCRASYLPGQPLPWRTWWRTPG